MIRITNRPQNGQVYISPFIQGPDRTVQWKLDGTKLTAAELDANGVLKPGVVLMKAPGAVAAVPLSGAVAYAAPNEVGVTLEEQKLASDNIAGTIATLGSVQVTVGIEGSVSRPYMEDMLGRALTAGELAALQSARSQITIIG